LVTVGSVFGGLSGTGEQIGGVSAAQLAEVQRRLAQQEANRQAAAEARAAREAAAAARAAAAGNGNGNGNGNGAGPGPFDISSAIPNNFWGYVMLVVGMR